MESRIYDRLSKRISAQCVEDEISEKFGSDFRLGLIGSHQSGI
jgi:hypothetical protein